MPGGNRDRNTSNFHHHERIDMKRIAYFLLALASFASLLLPAVAGVPVGTGTTMALATVSPPAVAWLGSPPPSAAPSRPEPTTLAAGSLGRCATTTQPPGRPLTAYQHNLRVALAVERRCEGRVYS